MDVKNILLLFLWGFAPMVFAQDQADSILLTKNFHFENGVYMSFEELQRNEPKYLWEEVNIRFFTNPQTSLTQVEEIFTKKHSIPVSLKNIFAIAIDGIPYIQLPDNVLNNELPTFVALKLRGKISYFIYPDTRMKTVTVSAYNPYNGRPFRTGTVEREESMNIEKILHFETGEILDFNTPNLLKWIKDDEQLTLTVNGLRAEEAQEKLFKCLLIYVDRNEFYLKAN